MHEVTKTTRAQRKSKIPYRRIEGEGVLVAPVSGEVVVLNGVGLAIWEWLAPEGTALTKLEQQLCETYEVDEGQAREDLHLFLDDLAMRGLVELTE